MPRDASAGMFIATKKDGEASPPRQGRTVQALSATPATAFQPVVISPLGQRPIYQSVLADDPHLTSGRKRQLYADENDIVATSVTRIVNQIADLERVAEIPRLLRLLAARSAQELNVAKLASEFGWSARTIDAYLAQLSSAFVLQLLPAWSVNLSSKVVHRPKIHLIDTGLIAALSGANPQGLLAAPERFGALLETFVVVELRKQAGWSETRPTLWHFRDRGGAEVDLVVEYPDGRVVAIEIKSGATPSSADLRGLRLLRDRLGDRFHHGYLATTAPEAHPLEERLSAIPVTALWSRGA